MHLLRTLSDHLRGRTRHARPQNCTLAQYLHPLCVSDPSRFVQKQNENAEIIFEGRWQTRCTNTETGRYTLFTLVGAELSVARPGSYGLTA